jgi:Transglycosylase SLT domain
VLADWTLSLMLSLEPHAACAADCPRIARAMTAAAVADPLFTDKRGVEETIAQEVALAWHESRFVETAKGDHGASLGLFQISPPTAAAPAADLLAAETAAPIAIRLLRQSFRICKRETPDHALAWYAAGGNGCLAKGFQASAHRIALAKRIYKKHPPPAPLLDLDRTFLVPSDRPSHPSAKDL